MVLEKQAIWPWQKYNNSY